MTLFLRSLIFLGSVNLFRSLSSIRGISSSSQIILFMIATRDLLLFLEMKSV